MTRSQNLNASGIPKSRRKVAVVVPGPQRRSEYVRFSASTTVNTILGESDAQDGKTRYKIEYEDGIEEEVSLATLQNLKNGLKALNRYKTLSDTGSSQDWDHQVSESVTDFPPSKRSRRRICPNHMASSTDSVDLESEVDSDNSMKSVFQKRRLRSSRRSSSSQSPCQSPYKRSRQSIKRNNCQSSKKKNNLQINPRNIEDSEDLDEDIIPLKRANVLSTRRKLPRLHTPASSSSINTPQLAVKLKKKHSKPEISDNESDELGRQEQESLIRKNSIKLRSRAHRTLPSELNRKSKIQPEKVPSSESSEISEISDLSDSSFSVELPSRRSCRQRTSRNLRELNEAEIFDNEASRPSAPKIQSIREIFMPISPKDPFRLFHNTFCSVCNGDGKRSKTGSSDLIYCQGCSISIHQNCLGARGSRDHLVTKIGHKNFVLQCRKCVGTALKKEETAPRFDTCEVCKQEGLSCVAFSSKKTAQQEEKLRQKNKGEDPITDVSEELINNHMNVFFRCVNCQRAYHFEHLPPIKKSTKKTRNVEQLRQTRLSEYTSDWRCKDCREAPSTIQSLVSWRLYNIKSYTDGQEADEFFEDEKEYLIKWSKMSYFECTWMPGSWVWAVTTTSMRKAFFRRNEGHNIYPKWTNEEAIPEEFLRIEIVLDVRYEKDFIPKSEKADKAAISKIIEVFAKFQGLTYDDVVWVKPPSPENTSRYNSFDSAYNEYLSGRYFHQSSTSTMTKRIEAFRRQSFAKHVELKKQPSELTGGKIMTYQLEGLNWLLYNFHQKKNVILADEMGLGKTIQIISLLVALVKIRPKCWPFLVVAPNSTCPNWRREIKKWAPSLRVVSYYGSKCAREMALKYEMYPQGCSDLRAHVIVTSFEAPTSDSDKFRFSRINWAGLIVDEGQRLKNDRNLLYTSLKALRAPFQILLTGTPLQNNKRELFNLLQFLDSGINASQLDEEYEELTNQNLPQLHELIRPFFLRRTKLQVLDFLPPMTQMIVPVTMSIVQKKLYKSILAKNPDLIKSVFSHDGAVLTEKNRGNLNNILMQLRKCLCHPFLYSSAIEERSHSENILFRNLIDASAKFQLLEIMLPKLRERGHRTLIFSQFLNHLDLIEDLLIGLDLPFQRLDGKVNSLEKQKRIDEFNAPNSSLFAFLLSTRAGGVGINLATADTVLIMDPDFNPHQDIQAISRAHRLGQEKKVLVFQLMTKESAEEKIIQIGRSKMALDKALIGNLDSNKDEPIDLESILRFGAEALFNDDDQNDIHYDSGSVDKLLDRTLIENKVDDHESNAEARFSFAKIWAHEKDSAVEFNEEVDSSKTPPPFSAWDKILEQREADAALEAAKNTQALGRGKRSRQATNYGKDNLELDNELFSSPPRKDNSKWQDESENDLDFNGAADTHDDESESDQSQEAPGSLRKPKTDVSSELIGSTWVSRTQNEVIDLSDDNPAPGGNRYVKLSTEPIQSVTNRICDPSSSHSSPNLNFNSNSMKVQNTGFREIYPRNTSYEQQFEISNWNYSIGYLPQQMLDSVYTNRGSCPFPNQYIPPTYTGPTAGNYVRPFAGTFVRPSATSSIPFSGYSGPSAVSFAEPPTELSYEPFSGTSTLLSEGRPLDSTVISVPPSATPLSAPSIPSSIRPHPTSAMSSAAPSGVPISAPSTIPSTGPTPSSVLLAATSAIPSTGPTPTSEMSSAAPSCLPISAPSIISSTGSSPSSVHSNILLAATSTIPSNKSPVVPSTLISKVTPAAFSDVRPNVPLTHERHCVRCGLPDNQLLKTCPILASGIQIRLMLDKVSSCKTLLQKEKTETVLRKELAARLCVKKTQENR